MRLGIDLGGTKIEILALDDEGRERDRRRIDTPRGSYPRILQSLAELIQSCERELGLISLESARASIGIGIPGTVDPYTGLVKNANTTELIGHPFKQDLEALLRRPVRVANDANCFALSEAVDGAAAGASVVFGIILGTGCGGGLIVDGKVLVGANAIGGEWGHNRLPDPRDEERPGPTCYCGRRGCIETFVSGTGLAQDYQRATGLTKSAREIAQLQASGDHAAQAAFERLEDRLARSLAAVINIVDPDCIVIGGGLSNVSRLYENIPLLWGAYIFTDGPVRTRLLPAKHGDSSGVRGAACLWPLRE